MKEYRCPRCGKKLFEEDIRVGSISIVCRGCKALLTIERNVERLPSAAS